MIYRISDICEQSRPTVVAQFEIVGNSKILIANIIQPVLVFLIDTVIERRMMNAHTAGKSGEISFIVVVGLLIQTAKWKKKSTQ